MCQMCWKCLICIVSFNPHNTKGWGEDKAMLIVEIGWKRGKSELFDSKYVLQHKELPISKAERVSYNVFCVCYILSLVIKMLEVT